MVDLDVVIVSHRDEHWLQPCLDSLDAAAGACSFRTTVVENGGASIALAETQSRRVLYMENLGFAAANNVGARESAAEFLLFLNPDTELIEGSLELLVSAMRSDPGVGLLATRQVTSDGEIWPSLHRFPSLPRAMAQALASERWPRVGDRFGERLLDPRSYARRDRFDWTTGAVLAVRREAFEAVGGFDESFFLFSEETDLCRRIQDRGWTGSVEPALTFIHHAGKAGVNPAREAQMAYARLQYARKHFSRPAAAAYRATLVLDHGLRLGAAAVTRSSDSPDRAAAGLALNVLLGRTEPPFRRRNGSPAQHSDAVPPRNVRIMGLPFDRLTGPDVIGAFVDGARAGTGGWIATPNLDILRQFSADDESRRLILAASHRVADGLPIVWASRLAGAPLPERVTGSDLAVELPEAAASAGLPVFLLGGNPGVAAAAAVRLRESHPDLPPVRSYCPPFGFEDDPEELARVVETVRAAGPRLVLVGLGFPKQERLIRTLREELPETWFVGVGISLSFLAGAQPRAPQAIQRLGLEWLYRLLQEPSRLFRRYVVQGLPFAARLFAWALRARLRGRSAPQAEIVGSRPSSER
jgi:N-acetylglucosaminyldiphosphoundecaprenol N-acetyl-beta-D-mannosaminyltransferase